MTRVAVERGLRPFQQALKDAGFVVEELDGPGDLSLQNHHAVVVSGMDENFLGITDAGDMPVVTAAGLTPQEVVAEVRRSLGPRE